MHQYAIKTSLALALHLPRKSGAAKRIRYATYRNATVSLLAESLLAEKSADGFGMVWQLRGHRAVATHVAVLLNYSLCFCET